ncbi:hypothetical protein QKL33_gp1 [Torque teno mini virus SHA]|uniref:Hepatitis TT virus Orf2/Gyrovirus Vp2 N-terminal domain-containing protein n=1 Tax=Torque teno mini virus SHA TaxID=2057931 RepID=A0A3S6Q7Y0_9VIRU|nr:hypothetical protein QKL33_gp1 [Torque teno mini virus SHA]AUD10247.1 hypothetical protein [Torque teno mini virus SHA]
MTNYYKQPTWSEKHKHLDWINTICAVHDLRCACDQPLHHTIIGIIKQEPTIKFNKEDTKIIQPCLTGGDQDTGDVVDGFGDDELERLFAEDTTTGEDDAR